MSVIIPAYNEESTIAEVVERVLAVELHGLDKEIVISDDGSVDNTPRVIAEIQQRYPNIVRVYTSPINLGKGAATRLGINIATGDVILIQDADLELFPEEYPLLLEPILTGQVDVVFGDIVA